MSTQYLAQNLVFHDSIKHIEIHFHYIIELVMNKELDVQYIALKFQLANILTKDIPIARFHGLCSKLTVWHELEFKGE